MEVYVTNFVSNSLCNLIFDSRLVSEKEKKMHDLVNSLFGVENENRGRKETFSLYFAVLLPKKRKEERQS